MTRACDLGPGDVWGSPSDDVDRCEHCGVEIEESCCHRRCESCRDTVECCVECQTCHRITDADEMEDDACVGCLVAKAERKNARRERWAAMLEDKGDEMREAYGTPRRSN